MSNPTLRVLVVHNLLWSHYKAAVFHELHRLARERGAELLVVQLAKTERSRLSLGDPTGGEHDYPYVLLHDGPLEAFGFGARLRALLRVVRTFRPTVVNLTGYYDPAQVALLAYCKLRGIRTVLSNESTAADHDRRGWKEHLKGALVRRFDGFFCFGTPSARYLLALGARPDQILTSRAAVVNDAVLRERFEHARADADRTRAERGFSPKNFVYVGRFSPEKNLPRLLDAFAAAREQASHGREWGLLLLGGGPQRADLEAQARRLGLDSVRFLPGVPWVEVPDVLALADALVLPSLSEPWGLVVNEAMVCGLPVLVSDRCGCAEDLVREGENGFTFPPESETRLAERLRTAMDLPDETRRRMGDASRQQVRAFSLPAVARAMMDGFQRVAAL